ncbi:MAG TPA: branched-chain-amino-acid transaminase [Sumerlaeia bacterium]|nr:branched-chain-amino-acid transaminase [Sumerlaeia bacterium]
MSEIVFIDGRFCPRQRAKISVFDHGLLYGDGVFEGIRLYGGCIFRLEAHLERLFASAKYLALKMPLTVEEFRWVTVETCRRNGLKDGYIRLVVTRGEGDLGLAPWICKRPSVICIAGKIALYPPEAYTQGLKIVTVPTRRTSVSTLNPRVKSCNYLNNILAKIEGHNAGTVEALMLDDRGCVIECTGDNIFIVKDEVLYTPPTYRGALKGITRDCIIEIAKDLGYTVKEEPFTRFEIFDADECFMTGTAAEVVPVVNLDARPIARGRPGPITKALNRAFREMVSHDGARLDERLPRPRRISRIWAAGRR